MKGRNILVVGAGMEGTKRIKSLSKHDCKIIIISETVNESLYEIEGKNNPIILIRRKIEDPNILNEFNDIFIVFASTNDPFLNKKIIEKAREKGILSYSIDDAAASDFFFTSIINIDEIIQVAISTSGKSPLMSKIIRDRIENAIKNIIGKKDTDNIKIQEFAREHVRNYIENQHERREFLYSIVDDQEIQELLAKNNIDKVKERIINTLDKWEDNKSR
ncbi:precorrin-2 dehydrogenase/sirohydrochlorin ferrochelatase family protein [Candidatus Nitrosocosmicus arcticus]|uniref:precorrin-2 dehydrogenase/sirohydrochlorin ferrochelatase family protein n=1 Tax=Candidatus Nitrosocosmicus arcticus TaxID=2035267 RepID=UPI0016487449|nr:bifunctional precorrin-2 dehydrogenase/sirohydrochlorin ferrochelatase [Candidatus Nitrosocosmicus arcticus]